MAELNHSEQIIAAAGEWTSRSVLVAVVPDSTNPDALISQMFKKGRLLRRGEAKPYQYKANPDWVEPARGGARPNSGRRYDNDRNPLASSMGAPCRVPDKVRLAPTEKNTATVLAAIESVFEEHDNDALTLDDLAGALDGVCSRADVAGALKAGIESGRFKSGLGEYWRVLSEPRRPSVPDEADAVIASLDPIPEPRLSANAPVLHNRGLRARLEAIAGDLDDACDDALDARLSHELLKALLTAQRNTQRALRQLEA